MSLTPKIPPNGLYMEETSRFSRKLFTFFYREGNFLQKKIILFMAFLELFFVLFGGLGNEWRRVLYSIIPEKEDKNFWILHILFNVSGRE